MRVIGSRNVCDPFFLGSMSKSEKWQVRPLGELCDPLRGITYGIVKVGDYTPGGVPVIRGGDIRDNQIVFNDDKRVTKQVSDSFSRTVLRGGEVVLNLIAEPGHSAVVPDDMEGFNVSRDVAVIPLSTGVNHQFVNYYLKSPPAIDWLTARLQGSVTKKINLGTLKDLPVPLPPQADQDAIANTLKALDDKIAANRLQVDLLESLIAATWERSFSLLNPSDWPIQAIGDVVDVRGGSTPRTTNTEYWSNGTISWATPRDLSRLPSTPLFGTERHITELGLQQISSGLLPAGVVLLSSRAPIGYLAIAELPIAINQGFIAIVGNGALSNLFMWQWVRYNLSEIKSRANGTTFMEINKATFRSMTLQVPPLAEVAIWTEKSQALYQCVVGIERESMALAQVRDTLLPKLYSGEAGIRNGDFEVENPAT